jgi:3-isopropylmalate/(R)-2-methylmalate dehydratase large subunit
MSIEAGARAGIVAPDQKTFDYLRDKKYIPRNYDTLIDYWKSYLYSDPNAKFDKKIDIEISNISPQVSWGTNPSMVSDINSKIPSPEQYSESDPNRLEVENALKYMGLKPGMPINEITIDRVFIGSCTNSRLEDLIEVSKIVKGRKVFPTVKAIIVPGSQLVKKQAETLGLHKIFKDANFEWRKSGCSMCLGMNNDFLLPGERCASTSNRNFEGRQGVGGRTHLVSPIMAAAAALKGHLVDVRELM